MERTHLLLIAAFALFATSLVISHKGTQTNLLQEESVYQKFKAWAHKYNKSFASPQYEQYRFTIFAQNLQKIENNKSTSYTLGENAFMDLTSEEFKRIHLGYTGKTFASKSVHVASEINKDSVDWRKQGKVSDVKDQGQCGSCWAFSTTGSVEAADAIFGSGSITTRSEQQLVDCSTSYGNMGCNGGLMDYAFQYIADHGITTEDAYAYTARDGSCKQDSGDLKTTDYTDVPQGDCDTLASAIAQQPVSVAVDAESWQFYSGGVFDDCGTQLDHGVLAVGYDSDAWIVKNSWGGSWGEQGYIRLARGNTCGICNSASYPSV